MSRRRCCTDKTCKIDSFVGEQEILSDEIRSAEHPQYPYPSWIEAEIKAEEFDTVKIFIAWNNDGDDGLYASFTTSSEDGSITGRLELFRKDGSQLGYTKHLICAKPNLWHRIVVCYDPDKNEFTACVDVRDERGFIINGQCVTAEVPSGFVVGKNAGYGGDGYIKNYKYERLWYIINLCPEISITTLSEGDIQPAESSQHGFIVNTGSPCYANINVFHPITGSFLGFFSFNDSEFDQFIANVNSLLSVHEPHGETWTVSGNLLLDFYGTNSSRFEVTATNGLADRELLTDSWIQVESGNCISLAGYIRGSEPPENEKQVLTIRSIGSIGAYNSDAGLYTLSFMDETTEPIKATASAAEIEHALESLNSIGEGNISVTGGPVFYIEFIGSLEKQNVDQIVATPAGGCCNEYFDDDYSDYGDICERSYCHRCGSDKCVIVEEDFSGIDGDESNPGDMPCGWGSNGTDWVIIDGKANGSDTIHHSISASDGNRIVSAVFEVDALDEMQENETVSVGLCGYIVQIKKLQQQYMYEFSSGSGSLDPTPVNLYFSMHRLKLTRCPKSGCIEFTDGSSVLTKIMGIPSSNSIYVSDKDVVNVISYTIHKAKSEDINCEPCPCSVVCNKCENGYWPSSIYIEISDLESNPDLTPGAHMPCLDINEFNSGFIVDSGDCSSLIKIEYDSSCINSAWRADYYTVGVGLFYYNDSIFSSIYTSKYVTLPGVDVEVGHKYLVAYLIITSTYLAGPVRQQYHWHQYWMKDMGTGTQKCLEFDEELDWIGWRQSPMGPLYIRLCGGGLDPSLTYLIPSLSKIRAISV